MSALLLSELFDAGDARFLPEVLASESGRHLRALAPRWYEDQRPFARQALLRYIDQGCDLPHHRGLVKGLFKLAEKAGDDEAMGHFLAAFDKLGRRHLKKRSRWSDEMVLAEDKTIPDALGDREARAPHFSRRTRRYLARRAFRYFRLIARQDPERYGRVIRDALRVYTDAQLQKPEQLLDSWGLLNALYWGCEVIVRHPSGAKVAEGRSLAELYPAPFCVEAWKGKVDETLGLVESAPSRTVRAFAAAFLRRDEQAALKGIGVDRLRALCHSPHEEALALAAELFDSARGLENLPLEAWLELLRLPSPLVVERVAARAEKLLSPSRLSLEDCVALATSPVASVAELGLGWAKKKPVADKAALVSLLVLGRAGVKPVREEAVAWIITLLRGSSFAKAEHLREILDSRYADARAAGLELMAGDDERFRESTLLWAALAESPYDDARGFLVRHLEERAGSLSSGSIRHVFATTLLAVRRGGRQKRAALSLLGERLAKKPSEAGELLPLFAVALHSVRGPERTAAIAAVARAAYLAPSLRDAIKKALPEVTLDDGEAA